MMANEGTSSAKKTAAKKTAAKKTAAKKTAAKKAPAKKTAAKKAPAKKAPAKKTAATKAPAKKAPATKTAATKAPAKKTAAKKTRKSVAAAARRASGAVQSKYFTRARERARKMVTNSEALERLAQESSESPASRTGPFDAVIEDFKTLVRLVVAYSRGQYRDIPLDSLVLITAGLVYVVSPLDLIPDPLPVVGYADDAVVIGYVIRSVRGELEAFRAWEEKNGSK